MPTCPRGQILRKGYTRKAYVRSDGTRISATRVPAVCVPDKGLPGKTPASRRVLPKPTRNALGKFGYHSVRTTPAAARHRALTRAVKADGYATIVQRLNLIANYNRRSNPDVHKIMRNDIAWLQRTFRGQSSKGRAAGGLLKVGKTVVSGKPRQLYKLPGGSGRFYRYRKADGTFGRRYV